MIIFNTKAEPSAFSFSLGSPFLETQISHSLASFSDRKLAALKSADSGKYINSLYKVIVLGGFLMSITVDEDLPIHQVISDWLRLPSKARASEQDAWNFVAKNIEKYDPKNLKHNHKALALAIIVFQNKIQEPLAPTPAVRMRATAIGVQTSEPRAVSTPRSASSGAIARKPLRALDRRSLTIG